MRREKGGNLEGSGICSRLRPEFREHTHTHTGPSTELYPFLSSFLSQWFYLLFSSAADAVWNNGSVGSSSAVGPLKRAWWGGGKVTLHRGTIFTTCPFNRQPIYSSRIFPQVLLHTAVPSQTPASDGTGGFAPRCQREHAFSSSIFLHTPLSPAAPPPTLFTFGRSARFLAAPRCFGLFNAHVLAAHSNV